MKDLSPRVLACVILDLIALTAEDQRMTLQLGLKTRIYQKKRKKKKKKGPKSQ